ncbi:DUF4231 domain-containing protein [Flavisolibacter sp. BT320]|nr:DUF4231 domain-containing protein [Flavisolibacter longurius]
MTPLKETDFPGLYQAADVKAKEVQQKHFLSVLGYSGLLLIASLFAFWARDPDPFFKLISASLFLLSLGLMIWQKTEKLEEIWYNARAVAESVKTTTWRFMTKASPYEGVDTEADQLFRNDIREILNQNEVLVRKLKAETTSSKAVSDAMKNARRLSLAERVQWYKTERIEDQQKWYSKKEADNRKMGNYMFAIAIALHGLAIGLLLWNIKEPSLVLPVSVIGVATSAVLGWMQAKKYNELASSYSQTAHEIALIKCEDETISLEEQFSEYVLNCEGAFSREHTQWVARKRK